MTDEARPVRLRGITWDHPRGFDPMVAASQEFSVHNSDIEIVWEKRSLQAFADRPLDEMVDMFDLLVIDHPHMGEAARTGLLLPLDGAEQSSELAQLARASVGASHASYEYGGRQLALAIDAATPVSAMRTDCGKDAPKNWEEVMEWARAGRACMALAPINALMTFFGLARNLDFPLAIDPAHFIAQSDGLATLSILEEIAECLDRRCLSMDPIAIYDWMSCEPDAPAFSIFGYGYTNYSREGFRQFPLKFLDAPGPSDNGPGGTVLGGAGIAVSAKSPYPEASRRFAFYVAGEDCQRSIYFEAGGQPAHAAAWEDEHCNTLTHDFFRNTRTTLETAWVRPRYNGYMKFQNEASTIVHDHLLGSRSAREALDALNTSYRTSQPG